MTQLIAGAHSSSGHPHQIRASHPHPNERTRSSASQTQVSDPDQIPGVGGKSMNGPINLLVKAALEVADDDHQRNPVVHPPSADQPHPASVATRSSSHPHAYPLSAHDHPHPYAASHSHDYGHYPDVPRQASGGSDGNRMVSGDRAQMRSAAVTVALRPARLSMLFVLTFSADGTPSPSRPAQR